MARRGLLCAARPQRGPAIASAARATQHPLGSNHNYFGRERSIWDDHQFAYNRIVRRLAAETAHRDLHLLDGRRLSNDMTGYAADLLHPAGLATFRIGSKLAARMRPVLRRVGLLG